MPELPEVETVVRGLGKFILNQTIQEIVIKDKRSWKEHPASKQASGGTRLKGLRIIGIKRRGKGIIINLSEDTSLLIHLKMTGQLIYIPSLREARNPSLHSGQAPQSRLPRSARNDSGRLNFGHPTDDFTNAMPSKHTRVIFKLSPNGAPSGPRQYNYLYFNDQRIFGWVKALPTRDIPNDPFIMRLGPEPFPTPYICTDIMNGRSIARYISMPQILGHCQRRAKSSIKAILLDQSVLAGLGNIYVDEVLFEAGIRPTRKGASITKSEATKIIKAIKKILKLGIKHSGTSIINYKTPEGSMGKMQNYLKVYMRDNQPCKVCKSQILKIRVASRGTHFCPRCQK